MTQAVKLAQLGSPGISTGFKNRIINGAMVIDQRNAGASVTATNTSADVYTLDRWLYRVVQASKMTIQQSTTAATGFNNSLLVTSSSAYSVLTGDLFDIRQYIEGYNVADLGLGTANAKTFTLSFWVRSSLTGTFGASVFNAGFNRSYPFSYTISAANTWEQKTVTIAGDTSGTWATNNTTGLAVSFSMGAGATYQGTANTWASGFYTTVAGATSVVGTNGATFYITGVQLEVGTTATDFDYRPYGTELALCQRYAYLALSGGQVAGLATYYSSTRFDSFISFPTTMRTTPSLTAASGTNYYSVYRAGAADFVNSLTINEVNPNGCTVLNNTEASGTAGDSGWLYGADSSAKILFSAEL